MPRLLVLLVILISCTPETKEENMIDIQGHRGARGLAPENSIPAFLLATNLGVNTLEMDLVVSADSQLVVSHEPFFSPDFCSDTSGRPIPEDSIINMYQLSYEEIKQFDCGSRGNTKFPEQERISTYKPLLEEVIDSVESQIYKQKLSKINYNIELKTKLETDSVFHPVPSVFSDLVYSFLERKQMLSRVTIQSFDFRTLQYFHQKYPRVKLALLIENELSWRENVDSLGFTPNIYSSYYQLLSQESVKEIQATGIKVIPWTVNEISDMNKLMAWGVDGIITDYPDRAMLVTERK